MATNRTIPINERTYLRPAEAAELIGVSRADLYFKLKKGIIPSFVIERKRLVKREDVIAWVESYVNNKAKCGF